MAVAMTNGRIISKKCKKNMGEVHYKNKTMRIADKTWDSLKDKRRKSGLSWNLFVLLLLRLYKKYGHDKKFSSENSNHVRVSPPQEKG